MCIFQARGKVIFYRASTSYYHYVTNVLWLWEDYIEKNIFWVTFYVFFHVGTKNALRTPLMLLPDLCCMCNSAQFLTVRTTQLWVQFHLGEMDYFNFLHI